MGANQEVAHVLIDWGTSSFRLWAVDCDGNLLLEEYEPLGMSKLSPSEYEPLLETMLSKLEVSKTVPVLICGMAGSAQGWHEAKYIDAPMELNKLSAVAVRVDTKTRDVRILPGIAQKDMQTHDVMRGEETLILGARSLGYEFSTYCLPGTHSKWVSVDRDKISGFTTFLTGELFALLSEQSTLSHYLMSDKLPALDRGAFEQGLNRTFQNADEITKALFKFRAGPLLNDKSTVGTRRSELSGMLIGVELASMKANANGFVGLIASGVHAETYALAFESAGIKYEVLDSKSLALAGLSSAAKQIWGQQNEH